MWWCYFQDGCSDPCGWSGEEPKLVSFELTDITESVCPRCGSEDIFNDMSPEEFRRRRVESADED